MSEADAETADLTELDRAVVNAFQGGFPVVERPFEPAAAELRERGVDVSATELLERIRALDEAGTLSRFGALVNAEEIGGTATLVAMHAPEDRFEEVAETVNAHREVAHNYEREHPHLNMWFVVSVADDERVRDVLDEIEAETGQETYNLPKQQEFRVEAKFLLDGPISDGDVDLSGLGPDVTPTDRQTLTPDERDLVVEIQGGLPITATPYADVAAAIDRDPAWVVETIKRFEREEDPPRRRRSEPLRARLHRKRDDRLGRPRRPRRRGRSRGGVAPLCDALLRAPAPRGRLAVQLLRDDARPLRGRERPPHRAGARDDGGVLGRRGRRLGLAFLDCDPEEDGDPPRRARRGQHGVTGAMRGR